ncbi:MAG: hypothetical protein ACREBU_21860 [Nitrososphaera sp.]
MARIKKDKSTPEKQKFWTSAEAALQEIHSWPEWKQSYVSPLLLEHRDRKATQASKVSKKKK